MRLIDARSGQDVRVGTQVVYADGTGWTCLAIVPGLTVARVHARTVTRSLCTGFDPRVDGRKQTFTYDQWVDVPIRYTHPRFFGQRVAMFPS